MCKITYLTINIHLRKMKDRKVKQVLFRGGYQWERVGVKGEDGGG
jgi:hypothetical protein